MKQTKLELTPTTVNAMHDAIGALVFAITRQLPAGQRAEFAQSLVRLAQSKNKAGNTLAATMLTDYATAADFAEKA